MYSVYAVPITGHFSGVAAGTDQEGYIVDPNTSLDGLSISGSFSYHTDSITFPSAVLSGGKARYFSESGGWLSLDIDINGKTIDFSNYENQGIWIFDDFKGFDLLAISIGTPDNYIELRFFEYVDDILSDTSPSVAFAWSKDAAASTGGYGEGAFF